MKEIKFDPIKHTYMVDGKKLASVTGVLGVIAKPALINWAWSGITILKEMK